jgi:hypothetical protein
MNIKAKWACKIGRNAFGNVGIETEEVKRWTVLEQQPVQLFRALEGMKEIN